MAHSNPDEVKNTDLDEINESFHSRLPLYWKECAKFRGAHAILGLVGLVLSCHCVFVGPKLFLVENLIGPKFFFVSISWG